MAIGIRTLSSSTANVDTATSLSITPTGQQQNDWLIFYVCSSGGTATHSNTAGSLTRVHSDLNNGNVIVTSSWKKLCAAGESGTTYSFSVGAATRRISIAVRAYTGGDATDIVDSAPIQQQFTTGSSSGTCTGATPTRVGGLHIALCGSRTNASVVQTYTWTAGWNEIYEFGVNSATASSNSNIGWAENGPLQDATATGDCTVTVGTAERFNTSSILLKSAVAGAPPFAPKQRRYRHLIVR